MADRTETQISHVNPTFLTAYVKDDQSLHHLKEYRTVGRISIIQSMHPSEMKAAYGEGSAIILPDNVRLIKKEESFLFVPLFFCAEFIQWRARDDKSGLAIVNRTYDATSVIASKARNADTMLETYHGGTPSKPWQYSFQEHLNFIGVVYGNKDMAPVAISFSRGEFKTGKSFSSKIFGRKIPGTSDTAPLWAQVWSLGIETHKNKKGNEWWGFSIGNPENPFIQPEEAESFRMFAEEFQKAYKENTMGVNMEGENMSTEEPVDNGSM